MKRLSLSGALKWDWLVLSLYSVQNESGFDLVIISDALLACPLFVLVLWE